MQPYICGDANHSTYHEEHDVLRSQASWGDENKTSSLIIIYEDTPSRTLESATYYKNIKFLYSPDWSKSLNNIKKKTNILTVVKLI